MRAEWFRLPKGRTPVRPFGFQRGVKPGCGLAIALRIFCRLRCALRSSLEPSARCGSSAAIWRSRAISSVLVQRDSRFLRFLSDEHWMRIEPFLPTDVRGVERVDLSDGAPHAANSTTPRGRNNA
jgi:hypothetical protein